MGFKDFAIEIIKLTDTNKQINTKLEQLNKDHISLDKRVVRLETLIEVSKLPIYTQKLIDV